MIPEGLKAAVRGADGMEVRGAGYSAYAAHVFLTTDPEGVVWVTAGWGQDPMHAAHAARGSPREHEVEGQQAWTVGGFTLVPIVDGVPPAQDRDAWLAYAARNKEGTTRADALAYARELLEGSNIRA